MTTIATPRPEWATVAHWVAAGMPDLNSDGSLAVAPLPRDES